MKTTTPQVITTLLVATLSILLTACGSGSSNKTVPPDTQNKLQGVWQKPGYGRALSISGNAYSAYDFTSETCALAEQEELGELTAQLDHIASDNSQFTLKDTPIGFITRYNKVAALPSHCQTPIGTSPSEIFEHVWHTFNEYYAFFAERGIDWLAQYDSVRDLVHDDMTDTELFAALSALIEPIDDVHVSISTPQGNAFSPGQPKGFYQDFIAEFEAQSAISDIDAYFDQQLTTALDIIDSGYLNDEYTEAGGQSDDFFKWGVIQEHVGYLSIGAFILQFDRSIAAQLLTVEDIIDQTLTDLNQTQALIIDVRLSPGGADPIALAIANRFADTERLAIRKLVNTIDGETIEEQVFVEPSSRVVYNKPVIVITSGYSASATEVFTLAMKALPQVTVIGEPTIGALSDILEKPLPNGWQLGLANEIYLNADGMAYEGVGIPPDIEVNAFAKHQRDNGQDSALNAALNELGFTVN